jgi:hypothetical protein
MRGFADDTELAEVASLGVRLNLEAGRIGLAAILQPVARAAWSRVAGDHDDDLLAHAERARDALSLTVGAVTERRFLESVIAHATPAVAEGPGDDRKILGDRG